MIEFICLIFPTFFAFRKKDYTLKFSEILIKYVKYNIIVNFITFLFVYIIRPVKYELISSLFTVSFIPKFLLFSSIIAYLLPIINKFIKKHIQIKLDIKKVEHEKN